MAKKCELCRTTKGTSYRTIKVDIRPICVCDACIREYGGVKQLKEAYDLGDVVFWNR